MQLSPFLSATYGNLIMQQIYRAERPFAYPYLGIIAPIPPRIESNNDSSSLSFF